MSANKITAYIFSDLGFGDSGKGASIDAFCAKFGIRTVIKYNSGPQSAHNVAVKDGEIKHTFSQYGSGALSGAITVLSEYFYVDPVLLLTEGEVLRSKGVETAGKMFVHYDCPIITPLHTALNRIKEQLRGNGRHGSCGVGHGEVAQTIVDRRDFVLRAADLLNPRRTYTKLYALQKYIRAAVDKLGGASILGKAHGTADLLEILYDGQAIAKVISWYREFVESVSIFFGYEQFLNNGDVAFEGGQGVLLDENLGFLPHATWTDTTPRNAKAILRKANFEGVTKVIGILRTFATRHGNGPLPSYCKKLSVAMIDPNNPSNTWQGAMRFGHFDFVTAAFVSAKIGPIDELYLTHWDHMAEREKVPVCIGYETKNYHQLHILPLENTGRENRDEVESAVPTLISISPTIFRANLESVFGAKITCLADGPNREDRNWII